MLFSKCEQGKQTDLQGDFTSPNTREDFFVVCLDGLRREDLLGSRPRREGFISVSSSIVCAAAVVWRNMADGDMRLAEMWRIAQT